MAETKKRKLHPPELKAKVTLEALRGTKTINEIGQEQAKTLFQTRYGLAPGPPKMAPIGLR